MNTAKKEEAQQGGRRKLILSVATLGLFPLAKLALFSKKKDVISCAPETKKIKMLSQDGNLVEVELSKITGAKEKISNEQLQSWVKKD